ncbi:TetR/AcrR family transcriptional regulator [Dermatobacter hominis]|uniref:TetR/AcrR family transcriptional regulator n=1 Tax=Dermatobacter hominis TaxID=2884263 RepID=UPI001D12B1FF|nr:TetR/AcrR family transcriptional regulator [Dermatobacter hominis]UDY37582.1 TetR/AcrR family transcriptional regulator; helix-turn-helix transcriptional regulator [Dermatobacter hominis]
MGAVRTTTTSEATEAAGPAARPLRADAARNRARLLAAATEAFERSGPEASLEDVAKRAGVGIGTLYRHFPTREALLEAVFRDRIAGLSALGDELLTAPDAFDSLATWLRAHLTNASACQGLAGSVVIDLLDVDGEDGQHEPACAQMRAVGAQLLERAQAEGSARTDVDAEDLVRLVNALVSATDDADERSALTERLFALMVDGLRAPSG